ITAAYAFTDYRSQGQTIPMLMVDIASPPCGALSLFNLYVALSRGDDRLDLLDRNTKAWWERMQSGVSDGDEVDMQQ
ncbi:hypothetical protein FB45DRAFT_753768, partial [Roridomyces roridus]